MAAGIPADRLAVDPGLGFAKTAEHNWELLAPARRARRRSALRCWWASSRKSFLGALLADADGSPRPVLDREAANVALTTIAAMAGVWGVRVHDVNASLDAVKVVTKLAEEPS